VVVVVVIVAVVMAVVLVSCCPMSRGLCRHRCEGGGWLASFELVCLLCVSRFP
jgi:hypothetical protein